MADIIERLDAITRQDLADVEEEIGRQRNRLDALLGLKRLIETRLGVQPVKRGGGGKGKSGERRLDAAHYLVRHGVTKQAVIAAELGVPNGSLSHLLNHPWFERTPKGVRLTEEGQRAAQGR